MAVKNTEALESYSEYYDRIKKHYGGLLPEQKLDFLRHEMQAHIGILRRVANSLREVDNSVWQRLFDFNGCEDLVTRLPEAIKEIEHIVEKYVNEDIPPLNRIECLSHYIPAGPFALVSGLSGAISEKIKGRIVPGLPDECQDWTHRMSETILKMRFLTYALIGKPL